MAEVCHGFKFFHSLIPLFFETETTFVNSCLRLSKQFSKGISLKGRICSYSLFWKEVTIENGRTAYSKSICFHLKPCVPNRSDDGLYRKNSKLSDTSNNCHNCPKSRKVWCNIALMHPKDADGMANSVDPDQTASSEAVWSWSALFAETYLSQYIKFVRYIYFT